MKRIVLLATAMALLPAYALANTSSAPDGAAVRRPPGLGPVAQVTPPCTPVNPCAVPTPEIGAVPPLPQKSARQESRPSSRKEAPHARL